MKALLRCRRDLPFKIPYPSTIRPPIKKLRNKTKVERTPVKGQWRGSTYYPSNYECRLPEWKVGDTLEFDLERVGMMRPGFVYKITKEKYERFNVTWLHVGFYDKDAKHKQERKVKLLADDWRRLRHPQQVKHTTYQDVKAKHVRGFNRILDKIKRERHPEAAALRDKQLAEKLAAKNKCNQQPHKNLKEASRDAFGGADSSSIEDWNIVDENAAIGDIVASYHAATNGSNEAGAGAGAGAAVNDRDSLESVSDIDKMMEE